MSEELKVNSDELVKTLIDFTRCSPVVIESVTEVKMNKKKKFELDDKGEYVYVDGKPVSMVEENPYLGATCRKFTNGVINFDYENAVNRQQVREGTEPGFEAKERKWGKHITRAVIEHKDKFYVQIRENKTYGHEYSLNGELIEYNKLKAFITPKKVVPVEESHQGVEEEIKVRDVKLDGSVKAITIDKVKYIVE